MDFKTFLDSKGVTAYRLAKATGVPYSCISDLCLGKTTTKNLTLEKACAIAGFLSVEPSKLLDFQPDDIPFRYFRNDLLSRLKRLGSQEFIAEVFRKKQVDYYYKNGNLSKALYTIALLDYLGCNPDRYPKIRASKLNAPFFVGGRSDRFSSLSEAEKAMGVPIIPEFAKYNIIEVNIHDVA